MVVIYFFVLEPLFPKVFFPREIFLLIFFDLTINFSISAILYAVASSNQRLLDKLPVTCPHSDSCEEILQRGNLDDHLRYRCSGTLVACQFAGAGCDHRGPSKTMNKHQTECKFKKEGRTLINFGNLNTGSFFGVV